MISCKNKGNSNWRRKNEQDNEYKNIMRYSRCGSYIQNSQKRPANDKKMAMAWEAVIL